MVNAERKEYNIGTRKIFAERLTPDRRTFEPTLLFVHGSFGGYFMWRAIGETLAAAGFECAFLSLRGHKPNPEADLSKVGMEDYVQDIRDVIVALGLKSPVLIGHSMGGLLVLMYEKEFDGLAALISIDPSPSAEVQGRARDEDVLKIPLVYNAMDAGMPSDPMAAMKAMPDISKETLTQMKSMLGMESGLARRERKQGISVPKETLKAPVLFIGGELGGSLAFGIPLASTKKMADYYAAEFLEIKGASHPGIIVGVKAHEVAEKIAAWLRGLPPRRTP